MSTQKLWILKTKGSESSFGGNKGYPDDPISHYVFDTNVKNHDKIKTGDIVVIVNKKFVLGHAIITSIDLVKNIPKIRYRCPICNTQEHYKRESKNPKYKCRKKHEFDEPIEENIIVDEYIANYKSTFKASSLHKSVKILDNFYIKRNKYYSIQPAKIDLIDNLFATTNIPLQSVLLTLEPDESYSINNLAEYKIVEKDERPIKPMFVKSRQGQVEFRNTLIKIHGSYCMISGIDLPQTIEASHINPYRGKKDHHPQNGLLLRIDLHRLFDLNLIGINPETLEIDIHPLIRTHYQEHQGTKIKINKPDFYLSQDALKKRWNIFQIFLRN